METNEQPNATNTVKDIAFEGNFTAITCTLEDGKNIYIPFHLLEKLRPSASSTK